MSLLFHHGVGVGLSCLLGGSTTPKTLAKCVLPGEGLGTPLGEGSTQAWRLAKGSAAQV